MLLELIFYYQFFTFETFRMWLWMNSLRPSPPFLLSLIRFEYFDALNTTQNFLNFTEVNRHLHQCSFTPVLLHFYQQEQFVLFRAICPGGGRPKTNPPQRHSWRDTREYEVGGWMFIWKTIIQRERHYVWMKSWLTIRELWCMKCVMRRRWITERADWAQSSGPKSSKGP